MVTKEGRDGEDVKTISDVSSVRRGLFERLFGWMTSWGIILSVMILSVAWLWMNGRIDANKVNQFISIKLPGIIFNLTFVYGPLWIFDQITVGETIALINNDKWTATVFWCVMAWITRDLLLYA